jgi:acetyl-CoA synthetase
MQAELKDAANAPQGGPTMSDKIYPVVPEWAHDAYVDAAKYKEMYQNSIEHEDQFWAAHGRRIDWIKPFTKVKNTSFDPHNVSIKWFEDGLTNVSQNCIDRHLADKGDQTAIIWEGDDPNETKHISYRQLHDEVCRFANILRNRNVKKGDRVTI